MVYLILLHFKSLALQRQFSVAIVLKLGKIAKHLSDVRRVQISISKIATVMTYIVRHEKIIYKMNFYGIRGVSLKIITNYEISVRKF